MKFTLEIELGNEAMQCLYQVTKAMVASANEYMGAQDEMEAGDRGIIRDQNGNTVGKWEVSE